MRLFGLLHRLGQASLRMEQVLWPEDYERISSEVEKALREASGVPHKDVAKNLGVSVPTLYRWVATSAHRLSARFFVL